MLPRRSLALLAFAFYALSACDDVAQAPDDVDAQRPDGPDVAFACTPGEILGCPGPESPSREVCAEDGASTRLVECPASSLCREGACVEVNCRPNTRRCVSESQPQVCRPEGDDYAFENAEACAPGTRCQRGVCLNRCQLAEQTSSYIGCEYWAVELENSELYQSETGAILDDEDERAPFAVVLANTDPLISARISVWAAPEEHAQFVTSREVIPGREFPGEERVTVYSEVVDADGGRVGQPLSGPIDQVELPPNSTMTLLLPNRTIPRRATSIRPFAYRVVSSEPVVAYQFNPFCCNYNYTNDASLLLPRGALTENYMYLGQTVWANASTESLSVPRPATLSVIALDEETDVTVQLRAPADADKTYDDLIFAITEPERVSGPDESGRITFTLQPFEVFNLGGRGVGPVEDLSGARVEASKPVSVFSGHSCANVPYTWSACDHLESQLFPLETWGTIFIASPLKLRNPDPPAGSREATYWKFVASENDTLIQTGMDLRPPAVLQPSGESVPGCASFSSAPATGSFVLNAGESCEFGTRHMFRVLASRPIAVGAFLSGQNTVYEQVNWEDRAGDPSFFLLPPEEQYRTDYSFLAPPTYFQSYAMVTMAPGFTLTLNGEEIDPMAFDAEIMDDNSRMRAHIPLEPGPQTIESLVPLGLVVYGYDNYVSYAYTGGLNLTKLNVLD
ncbi:hypothetical protein DL240_14940 [Lujinxingia litoralis]|uniref:IgGFc-binding protein N-terminal domain-containing protein n=1 Tax=Lujinxingia litoralis TaxID=2211119 RepID=A0A328C4N9_9DELT|nr:IgGFc-binding protein [Lujinxingia litoralis]RAL20964.1 hypothetical protein DL240_14940 [Lujinxingia litoralis]